MAASRSSRSSPASSRSSPASSRSSSSSTRSSSSSSSSSSSRAKPRSTPASRTRPVTTDEAEPREQRSFVELDGRDRSADYRRWAESRAAGDVLTSPVLLRGQARREHVRRTLLEDHRARINNRPQGAQRKFDTLASDPFTFFRGTALLYYRDHGGTDGHLPVVLTVGDVHPENFGVMPNSDGAPFFGVNDFDEAWAAPFSYDVRRGAVGFWLVAQRNTGDRDTCRRVVRAFVDGYLGGLRAFAEDDRSSTFQFRLDNSPKVVRRMIEEAVDERADFLAKYVDLQTSSFRPSRKRVPHSSHVDEFQDVVDRYVADNDLGTVPRPDDFFTVLDVARKKGSGTGSLGLDRYWILLQGWGEEPDRCVVLELKQARRSALYGLVPPNDLTHRHEADGEAQGRRIVTAQQVHLVNGDALYGYVDVGGTSFLVRERSPYKYEAETKGLSPKQLRRYAGVCGQALAQPHARSDEETGILEGSAEHLILASLQPELFVDDTLAFAEEAAARVHEDFDHFRRDHALGAFRYWDVA
ncbi:DUF2252 domain-containing protein [Aquipuribacter sp. SD81]|uniref:DUF2252 domain-containing protein n=1 Tax=Aquipuribacter sp. SD81 TaxID=3127703 RepID=UPI00301ABAA9